MTANKEMVSSFLKDSRSSSLSSDKRSRTVTWDCTPGKVFYNYVIPGGSTQRKGYYNHEGIYRYSSGSYKKANVRYDMFEGVKCTKIQYRKNNGTWSTISNSKGIPSSDLKRKFTSSKNGDKYEIKVTYQVWTMGQPFRDVPFMWFGTKSGVYNDGKNKFTQSTPANPGRGWSGMSNYEKSKNGGSDKNSSWKITNYSWYQPNSSSKSTNWTYLHAKRYHEGKGLEPGGKKTSKNAWLSTACEKWLKGMPYGKDMGWTGNVSGVAPQNTRKSSWWTFEKTFTDSFTVSGLKDKPDPLSNPTVSLKVINNLTTKDSQGVYNGIAGTLQFTYKQNEKVSGTYKVYAYQNIGNNETISVLVNSGNINNNETKTINVKFTSLSNFKRSKTIAYLVRVETPDPEYNTTRVSESSKKAWSEYIKCGTHYFNEEPLYSSSFTSKKTSGTSITLNWNKCTDPDGHSMTYYVVIGEVTSIDMGIMAPGNGLLTNKLRVKSGNGYVNKQLKANKIYSTTNTSYTIDISSYSGNKNLNIFLIPADKYFNDYYYANSLSEVTGPETEISINVIDNMTNNDDSGVISGEHGKITVNYKNRKGIAADVEIYSYVSNNKNDKNSGGHYCNKACTIKDMASGTSKSVVINFEGMFERGRYIKYFAVAKIKDGTFSDIPDGRVDINSMWSKATGWHYFNSIPTAVTPYLVEDRSTVFNDNRVDIAWPKSTDLEGHDIYYTLYIKVEGLADKNETFYIERTDNPVNMKYTQKIELWNSTYPSTDNPYTIDVSKYIGRNIYVWIKTEDKYKASKYLTGNVLDVGNPAVSPSVPSIKLDYAYSKDLYGKDKVDGENGYVSVSYSHPAGRDGSVYLHAICKKPDGTMQAFKDIASFQLDNGKWSSMTKLNFPKIFGNEWRTSEIRYYATAKSNMGEWSESSGASWKPATSMWETFKGSHKFNEEPGMSTIRINHDKCNMHDNIFIEWDKSDDIDDAYTTPSYAVVFCAMSDLKSDLAFIQGQNGTNINHILSYTDMWDTVNTNVDIDISKYGKDEKFRIYVIAHDDYANSYYYMSSLIDIGKIEYGKPKVSAELSQNHSEYGYLTIKYEHEDCTWDGSKYISNDPEHRQVENGDFDGSVSIYAIVDNVVDYNYSIEDVSFKLGEVKNFTIDFDEVCPYSRSHEIRYYIVATDKLTGVKNHNESLRDAAITDYTSSFHYYNDEPYDPEVIAGPLLDEKDRLIYGFEYLDIVWETPFEPDKDACMYYLYLRTPASLNEEKRNVTLTNREYKPLTFEYTRKYRIVELYNPDNKAYGCKVEYYDNATNQYRVVQEKNDFIGIRIPYKEDHLGKEWPENEEYAVVVEARDVRIDLENSYYGVSNEFVSIRKRHQPPNDVDIEVTYNLTDGIGDGERGKMKVTYTHPETSVDATVTIYAYQDNKLITSVYTGDFYNGESRVIEHDFTKSSLLKRSKYITYYAVATDKLVGMTSLDKYFVLEDNTLTLSNDEKLQYIPYLIADADGNYGICDINIKGVMFDYNENGHYKGPIQKGLHYYNEEPPSTTPTLYNDENITFKYAEIKWPHVKDPDGDDVSYEIYVAGNDSDEYMNSLVGKFFTDKIGDSEDIIFDDDGNPVNTGSGSILTSIDLRYHKMVTIPSSLGAEASDHFSLSTEEYSENTTINIWMVSKDPYTNSYYRSGEILTIEKGHDARPIRAIYPRNGSTVYATQPRILIYLGEDSQRQTTYVGWKGNEYNNRDNPEMFSSYPNNKNVIIFKPPEPFTTLSGTKVSYYVYAHNQCSYTDKKYATYTYKDFFNTFTEDMLIAIKADHINLFRNAINITRDAYGLPTVKFSRDIKKNMILENYDFNETKNAICEVNDLLNNADDSEELDYNNSLIVDVNDLDLVEYEGIIGTTSYNEFLEWARLVYILQNL